MRTQSRARFLQINSAILVLVATALYQHKSASFTPERASVQAKYERYEEALQLLSTRQPRQAAERIAALPDSTLEIQNTSLPEYSASFAPAVLILRLGSLLAHHTELAVMAGRRDEALLLRDTIALLQHRLERGARADETSLERAHRLQVTEALTHYCQRMTAKLALTATLPETYSS